MALQRFLGLTPMEMDGLDMLERKSSNRPGIHYLQATHEHINAHIVPAAQPWRDRGRDLFEKKRRPRCGGHARLFATRT